MKEIFENVKQGIILTQVVPLSGAGSRPLVVLDNQVWKQPKEHTNIFHKTANNTYKLYFKDKKQALNQDIKSLGKM